MAEPQEVDPPLLNADPKDELYVARYGMLTDDRTANQLRALAPALVTESKGFTLYRVPADRLHQTLRQLRATSPLVPTDSMIGFSSIRRRTNNLLGSMMADSNRLRAAGLPDLYFNGGGWRLNDDAPQLTENDQHQLVVNLNSRLDSSEIVVTEGRRPWPAGLLYAWVLDPANVWVKLCVAIKNSRSGM